MNIFTLRSRHLELEIDLQIEFVDRLSNVHPNVFAVSFIEL